MKFFFDVERIGCTMIHPSTFSIVAHEPQEAAWGIAVASKFLAVGSVVPWAKAGVGAIATQSYANTSFGPRGLDLMEQGFSARETLERLLADDPERELRQVGMIDHHGGTATFTGKSCYEWAGGIQGKGFAAQGNILAGAQVIEAMADTFTKTAGNLPQRLFAALLAGDRAGGDRRGRQSAAIYVVKPKGGYGGFNDRWGDFRVDDHPDPVTRLGELLDLNQLYFGKSPASEQLLLEGDVLRRLQRIMIRLGYYDGEANGIYDEYTQAALGMFTGNENFEERVNLKNATIDLPVYEFIMRQFWMDS
jgi:uncharacterized Ntn-hydrolase superfamily protein